MKRLKILRRWFARRFGYARLVCLALLIGLAASRIADPAPVEELRVRTFDTFQLIDPRVKTARPVTIIDIDEKSLSKLGQFPWPRTRIADLIANLTKLGAVVIGFDIVFSEPDRLNPDVAADTIRNLDEETRTKLRALPSNDQIFADAMRRSRVVLGESGLPYVLSEFDNTLPVTGLAMLGEAPQPFLLDFPGLLRNVDVLEQAAAGRGLFTIKPERDGIVRRVPMMMLAQGAPMPSLSFEILRVATGTDTIFIKSEKAGIKSIAVKGFEVPTDRNGQLWIHFARRDPSIYVSASDVLEGRVAPERIARKLVLIGTSAVGLLDLKTTPIDRVMPGVEVHAQVLESALTRVVLSQPNYGIVVELCAAIVLGLLVIAFAPLFGPVTLVAVGGLFASLLVGTSWYFYSQQRLLIDFTYPLLSTTAIYLTLIFSSFDREHQLNACEAALDMLERIEGLNEVRQLEAKEGGHPYIPINVGVGLNTGTCVVGNMGSDLRFDYSVLGDSVNLASRLEGQSKEYGFPIIVGSRTALAVKDKFAILELDFIMVKGKKEPEVIYAIAGREDTAQSGRFQRLRNLTIEMLACYRSRDWEGALAAIERGRRTDDARALELLYNLYEARILGYQKNPPPEDWNGAFALLTK